MLQNLCYPLAGCPDDDRLLGGASKAVRKIWAGGEKKEVEEEEEEKKAKKQKRSMGGFSFYQSYKLRRLLTGQKTLTLKSNLVLGQAY